MEDFISKRKVAEEILNRPFTMSMCLSEAECHAMNRARKLIAEFVMSMENDIVEARPPAAVGKWIDTNPDIPDWSGRKGGMSYYCSVCLHPAGKHKHNTYKFCPWCGAFITTPCRMRILVSFA